MIKTLWPLIFLILIPQSIQAQLSCQKVFDITRVYRSTRIEKVFTGFIKTTAQSNREMFVKIERPRASEPKKWMFLIHGLLDSHVGWNTFANRALESGYGVVRVDLHGHARTLVKNQENKVETLDSTTNYKTNVEDVIHVLEIIAKDYGIEKPELIGHSYGGGIATAIATDPIGKTLIGNTLTVIAPYIYRIDGYHTENSIYFLGGLAFLNLFRSLVPPKIKAHLEAITSDLYTEPFMQKLYTKHFTELLESRVPRYRLSVIRQIKDLGKRSLRRAQREKVIADHVQAAIEITKGIRQYDGREAVGNLPDNITLNLVLGKNDKLVPRQLELEFYRLIQKRGIRINLFELEGIGHMVINEAPTETLNIFESTSNP